MCIITGEGGLLVVVLYRTFLRKCCYETLSLAGFLQPSVLSLKGCMHQFTHDTASLVAKRLSARLLILQSVFSVGGVWPQLPSRFRNAVCHASGVQARVWLVCKHPSRFRNAIKSSCLLNVCTLIHVCKFVIPSAMVALAVSLSKNCDESEEERARRLMQK